MRLQQEIQLLNSKIKHIDKLLLEVKKKDLQKEIMSDLNYSKKEYETELKNILTTYFEVVEKENMSVAEKDNEHENNIFKKLQDVFYIGVRGKNFNHIERNLDIFYNYSKIYKDAKK